MCQIDWLYNELGINPPTPDDLGSSSSTHLMCPTSSVFASSSSSRSSASSDPFLASSSIMSTPTPAGTRARTPTPFLLSARSEDPPSTHDQESEYRRIFNRFIARLDELSEEAVTDPNKPGVGLEGVDPTPELTRWAENTQAELEDIKRRREAHIQAMYDQLDGLWRRLGVSDAEMDAFVEGQRGSTEEAVRAYEEELDRMLELKRERMSTFVENARQEITTLWDELMVGEEERANFAPFADGESYRFLAVTDRDICCRRAHRRVTRDTRGGGPQAEGREEAEGSAA